MITRLEVDEFLKPGKKRKKIINIPIPAAGGLAGSYTEVVTIPNITRNEYNAYMNILIDFYNNKYIFEKEIYALSKAESLKSEINATETTSSSTVEDDNKESQRVYEAAVKQDEEYVKEYAEECVKESKESVKKQETSRKTNSNFSNEQYLLKTLNYIKKNRANPLSEREMLLTLFNDPNKTQIEGDFDYNYVFVPSTNIAELKPYQEISASYESSFKKSELEPLLETADTLKRILNPPDLNPFFIDAEQPEESYREKEMKGKSKKELLKQCRVDYFYMNMPLKALELIKDHVVDYEEYMFHATIIPIAETKQTITYSGLSTIFNMLKKSARNKNILSDISKVNNQLELSYNEIGFIERKEIKQVTNYKEKTNWSQNLKWNYLTLFPIIELATLLFFKLRFKEYLQKVYKASTKGFLSHATYAFITEKYYDRFQSTAILNTFITNFEHLKNYNVDHEYILSMNDKHRLLQFLVCFKVYHRIVRQNTLEFNSEGLLKDKVSGQQKQNKFDFSLEEERKQLLEKYYFLECRSYYNKFWNLNTKANKEFTNYINNEDNFKFYRSKPMQ